MSYPIKGANTSLELPVLDDRLNRLTAGQRDCLRLVAQLQSSKQIARMLGISNYTVDQRIARACRTLNAATRVDAALMLARHEAAPTALHSISDNVAVATDAAERPAFPQIGPQPADAGDLHVDRHRSGHALHEPSGLALPLPVAGRRRNDMSFARRLAWAAAIAAMAIIVVGVLLASLAAIRSLA